MRPVQVDEAALVLAVVGAAFYTQPGVPRTIGVVFLVLAVGLLVLSVVAFIASWFLRRRRAREAKLSAQREIAGAVVEIWTIPL